MNPSRSSKELIGIQYLRGIAALMVVLDHTASMFAFPKYFGKVIFSGWFEAGAVGVPLFFVISGFIIPFVSLSKNTVEARISAATFFRRRFIRIIPFMWVCIISFASLRILGRGVFPVSGYLRSIFLFPVGPVEPKQIWTLRHEFLFYTLFCFSLIYLKKGWILHTWFAALVFWTVFRINDLLPDLFLFEFLRFLFSRFNLMFVVGYFIGIAYLKGYFQWRWNTSKGFLVSCFGGFLLLYVASMQVSWVVTGLISGVLVIVLGLMLTTKTRTNITDRLGLLIGDASYSIYLTHGIFVAGLLGFWSKMQHSANPNFVLFTITILSCIGGVLIHLYVEKPLIRTVQKVFDRKNINKNAEAYQVAAATERQQ